MSYVYLEHRWKPDFAATTEIWAELLKFGAEAKCINLRGLSSKGIARLRTFIINVFHPSWNRYQMQLSTNTIVDGYERIELQLGQKQRDGPEHRR